MKKHFLIKSVFFTFMAIFFLFACSEEDQTLPKENQVGSTAPLIKLNDLSGKSVSLADHKGMVVLLRFWSTACKSCKEELPKLESLYQEFKPSGLRLITINIKDSPEKISTFIDGLGLTFPILLDKNKSAAKDYKVYGVPTSFLIDKEGIITKRRSEEHTSELQSH